MPTPPEPWKNIVNLDPDRLEFKRGEFEAPHYAYEQAPAATGKALGARKIGFNVSTLPPKQFTCPYHFHHSEEEIFLILKGRATLRQAGRFREVSQGDLIVFTADAEGAHQFYNPTDEPMVFLALSTLDPLDIAEYPDSGKLIVRRLRKLFKAEDEVPYLTGEEDPRRHWPADRL